MSITIEEQEKIRDYVMTHHLPTGLGTKEEACSIAAFNLVLSGKLTDDIPDCMSKVIGRWIIPIQDAMPDDMRNSDAWKTLLPLAAGTGRELENERLEIILAWMWDTLRLIQTVADKNGFGSEWAKMCHERDNAAAKAAAYAAHAAYAAKAAADAARAARAATDAAARAATDAANRAAARAAARAADTAAYAADAADAYAADAADAANRDFWRKCDPPGLLKKLIEAGGAA